jgi:hypothetical protein
MKWTPFIFLLKKMKVSKFQIVLMYVAYSLHLFLLEPYCSQPNVVQVGQLEKSKKQISTFKWSFKRMSDFSFCLSLHAG